MISDNKVLLSILVTCYNQQPYIYDCLNSIINFAPSIAYEIIIINDGSNDDSEFEIKRFLDKNSDKVPVLYISNENHGVAEARNLCLSLSKGYYQMFIDGDDYWYSSLDVLKDKLMSAQIDIFTFHAKFINESGQDIPLSKYFKKSFQIPNGLYNGSEFFKMAMSSNRFNCTPYLYIFKKTKFRFIPAIVFEDELFTSELIINSKQVMATNHQLYARRVVSNSITHQMPTPLHFRSFLIVIESLLLRHLAQPKEHSYIQHINNLISSYNNYQSRSPREYKKYYKDFFKLLIKYKFITKIRPMNFIKLIFGRIRSA